MFDFPALDVAIGIFFLYIILALVCTTINEAISTAVGLRARFLQRGLLNLLSAAPSITDEGVNTARAFYSHPLVQGLIRPGRGPDPSTDPTKTSRLWQKPPYPSYIPSRTFVTAITDLASITANTAEAGDDRGQKAARRAADELEESLAAIPNERLSAALLALYRSVGEDASRFQHAAEQWYDDSMERVSGWYKRRVHLILFLIATAVVLILNADTLSAARVLWRDDAARATVVQQAEAATQRQQGEGNAAQGQAPTVDRIDVDKAVEALPLPIGWETKLADVNWLPPWGDDWLWRLLAKLAGLGLTIGAIMLGAPFWFDLLSKVMRVRATGAPPPASDSDRTGEGEQPRAGRRGRTRRRATS